MFTQLNHSGLLECGLCPHQCAIPDGGVGICGVRSNANGELRLMHALSAVAVDPIEKKPLYHFHAGKNILSVGGYGCNLRCSFCQNHHISQNVPQNVSPKHTPPSILNLALQTPNNIGVAYTYNEPTMLFELMLETAQLVSGAEMCNVMVTNGFINQKPLALLLEHVHAFNVDLKAFTHDFYRKYAGAELQPVLDTLIAIKKAGRHLEITYLVIPSLNDSATEAERMFNWIASNLGADTPLHINRYFPMYRLDNPPTSLEKLHELRSLAEERLLHVHLGNVR